MSWNAGLSESALKTAKTDEKRLRVMAGSGAGKSVAMKRHVVRLLEQGQDPARVLAVTFTRSAAANLVQNLADLHAADCESIRAGTLHSWLFYVAITRCEEILVLSSFTAIKRGDASRMNVQIRGGSEFQAKTIASRSINELGPTAPTIQEGLEGQTSDYNEEIDP